MLDRPTVWSECMWVKKKSRAEPARRRLQKSTATGVCGIKTPFMVATGLQDSLYSAPTSVQWLNEQSAGNWMTAARAAWPRPKWAEVRQRDIENTSAEAKRGGVRHNEPIAETRARKDRWEMRV